MITRISALIVLLCCTMSGIAASAEPPALTKMGIKEITVFKDGHTFVLHAAKMPTDAEGNVSLDYLPTPILGTFWPYSADKNASLISVTAGPRRVKVEKTALNVRELIEANPGAKITLTQTDGKSFDAEIVRVPRREVEAPTVSAAPTESRPAYYNGYGGANAPPLKETPPRADAVLVRTKEAVIAVPFSLIKKVAFRGPYKENVATDEYKNRLLLKLDWAKNKIAKTADVGMVYLQKGVRWIPHYRISIDGKGNAIVRLQATLINELADFKDVTANLVIGTPSFFFKDTPDPISLQQSFPALSRYFQSDSQTGHAFSSAIMSQGGFGGGGFGGGRTGGLLTFGRHSCLVEIQDNPPNGTLDNISADKNEDLYVFAIKHISLRRGETMALTIAEVSVPYRDVYTLEMPFAPPETVKENTNQISRDQLAELNRIARTPRARHRIRLTNTSSSPFTTAPALIVSGDRVLAQGLTTYTPTGGDLDVTLTTAGDIKTTGGEHIEKQTSNVTGPNGASYFTLFEKAGEFTVTNFGVRAIKLEVIRFIPGKVGTVTPQGTVTQVGLGDNDNEDYYNGGSRPYWWNWYYWPWYWDQFNGLSRIAWSVELEPGKSTTLKYTYRYFWE